jgi:hypothetical protein
MSRLCDRDTTLGVLLCLLISSLVSQFVCTNSTYFLKALYTVLPETETEGVLGIKETSCAI